MRTLIFFLFCVAVLSCNNEVETEKKPEDIFYDYRITAEEGKDDVTLVLQYRLGGKEGEAVMVEEPGKVLIDGAELAADSAGLTGVFYELVKPLSAFSGQHKIVFIDQEGKEHVEEFIFQPFTLAAEFKPKVKKQPFAVQLNGLPDAAAVRLVITDTAFSTRDVNEELVVRNGELVVDEYYLNDLSTGPVNFEIYREEEKKLKNPSGKGGRMITIYSLKRQFDLVE